MADNDSVMTQIFLKISRFACARFRISGRQKNLLLGQNSQNAES